LDEDSSPHNLQEIFMDYPRFSRSLCLLAAIAFAQAVHGQTCAGGVGGGMDATGNECNHAVWQLADSAQTAVTPVTRMPAPTLRPVERSALAVAKPRHSAEPISKANHRIAAIEQPSALKSVASESPR
jgi:hypothetical protein